MPPLLHDIWTRRGLSLLWGADALSKAVKPSEIVSLRALSMMAETGFPEKLPSNQGRLIVATGLEGALDVLTPDDAASWVGEKVRPLLGRFQEIWDGEGALVFWLPSGRARIIHRPANSAYLWRLPTGHGDRTLPLSALIFSGAASDLERLVDPTAPGGGHDGAGFIGLYHPRVS